METSSSESNDDSSSDYEDSRNESWYNLEFDIEFDQQTWDKIRPTERVYRDGTIHNVLYKSWTQIYCNKVWKETKIKCCYSIKKHYFYKGKNKPYFYFYGHCSERKCGAKFTGTCESKPLDNTSGIKVHVKTIDTSLIHHKKKRFLAGDLRVEAQAALQYITGKHFKAKEVEKLMDDSDPIPAILSNSGVYQTARQEVIDRQLKLEDYPGRPIESLHAIMDHGNEIKMISTTPFIVMYWTDQQIKLWNEADKLPETDTSIDATGSFVKKVNIIADNYSSDIFLYIIVIRFSGKIYPVAQMLSDSHNTNTITDFLVRCKENGAPIPNRTNTDCSLALLNAIALAYNGCSYNDYLTDCFRILRGQNSVLPQCLIKRDRNHLIKNVTKWKCFDKSNEGVKDFYCRCIAYALRADNLQLFEEILVCIFIVSQSNNCNQNSKCYQKKKWLIQKIETFDYNNLYEEGEFGENQYHNIQLTDIENLSEMPNEIIGYLKEINSKCQAECSNNDDGFAKPNFLQCPGIVDSIILLFSQFPAWTNVMHSFYPTAKDVSSSTGSEGYNRIMKNIYNMNRPVSVNRFILKHLKFIASEIKIGRATVKTLLETLLASEGGVKQTAPKLDSNKMDIVIKKLEKNNCNQWSDTDVIINGMKLPPVNIRDEKYKFTNTCSFDSIAELFVEAYKSFKSFKNTVDVFLTKSKSNFFELVRDHTSTNDSFTQLYSKRAEILWPFIKVEGKIADCEMNVTSLFEKLTKSFSDTLGCVSCNLCGSSRTLHYQTKILQEFDTIDSSDMWTNLLISALSKDNIKCREYSNPKANLKYKAGSYIAFDVEHVFENASKDIPAGSAQNAIKFVNHLPTKLKIADKDYGFLGVISFVPVENRKNSHYVAYLRKSTFWEERNDLEKYVNRIPVGNLQIYIALIVYIECT